MEHKTYCVKMMETASLSTLSPKTIAYKSWSAFIELNNAKVDTGSVAEIKEPKLNASISFNGCASPASPRPYIVKPTITADIVVPSNAYVRIAPMLLKKSP